MRILNWLRDRNLLLILTPLLLFIIPVINICAWLLARLSAREDFMPQGYRVVWTKPT
jgi:hypothetical protein